MKCVKFLEWVQPICRVPLYGFLCFLVTFSTWGTIKILQSDNHGNAIINHSVFLFDEKSKKSV